MLVVLSPAKKLEMARTAHEPQTSEPRLLDQTADLMQTCKSLKRTDIKRLMKLSDPLTELNFERFQGFSDAPSEDLTRAAMLAFRGDTYQGLDADTLSADDQGYAQDHLRLLSGLYGVLRPLDAMQAYRLEMGTKLPTPRGGNLYDFWGDHIASQLDADLVGHDHQVIVNGASSEYFTAAKRKSLKATVITPVFKEVTPEHGARVLGLFAKKARGSMARFIIQNRIDTPEGIKDFNLGGYTFTPEASDATNWVFQRPQPAKKAA